MPSPDAPANTATAPESATPETSPEEAEILATCQAFFDVLANRDIERGLRLTTEDSAFYNVRVEDGEPVVGHFEIEPWLLGLADDDRKFREYFTGTPRVLVHGNIAVVWAEYVFELNGKRSHSGIDAFNLVRTTEGWKICGGVYDMEH